MAEAVREAEEERDQAMLDLNWTRQVIDDAEKEATEALEAKRRAGNQGL